MSDEDENQDDNETNGEKEEMNNGLNESQRFALQSFMNEDDDECPRYRLKMVQGPPELVRRTLALNFSTNSTRTKTNNSGCWCARLRIKQ